MPQNAMPRSATFALGALILAVCLLAPLAEARLLSVKRPQAAERTALSGDATSTVALPPPPRVQNSAQAADDSDKGSDDDDDDEKGDPAFKPFTGLPPRQASAALMKKVEAASDEDKVEAASDADKVAPTPSSKGI
ncbi:hypothetical protein T484DRAFT_1775514 [Baffinella frigidus]|nr:hypothetical protein T484DRAFT_1775514 [Cryptophyta sp. CCMP2293]